VLWAGVLIEHEGNRLTLAQSLLDDPQRPVIANDTDSSAGEGTVYESVEPAKR
jgi:hypothetical protein